MALVAWCPMLRELRRIWRLGATGFGFAVFFGGGAVAAATLFPLIRIFARDSDARSRITTQTIHRMFRAYLAMLQALGALRFEIHDAAALAQLKSKVIVANHPSLLDVVLLMAAVPRVQCIVKHQLWSSCYLGGVVRQAGYIRNDLPAEDMMMACRAAIDSGSNLIIFPQGTRTPTNKPLHFQRGFANIALSTHAGIQTVKITCDPPYLAKGQRWWKIPDELPTFRLTPGDCLVADGELAHSRPLAARALVRKLETYYAGFLANG